jgi:hypothetical protein
MRTAIIPLALVACFEAVQGFAPAAVGLTRSSALPSARAISGIRGGSGLVAAKMASAYDFKLPLAGTPVPARPARTAPPAGRLAPRRPTGRARSRLPLSANGPVPLPRFPAPRPRRMRAGIR